MKPSEIVEIFHTLENKNLYLEHFKALELLGYYDQTDDTLVSRIINEPYNPRYIPRSVYNKEEIDLINSWAELLGEDNFNFSPFCERTFLRNFLANIPTKEQINYLRNTNLYYGKNHAKADPKYVLVTRRALPSKSPKSEKFWSDEPTTTFWGLRHEIRGEQRAYSVIMVSTLGDLQEHGKQDINLLSNGVSDGEIVTSNQPFPTSRVLFAYKPLDEITTLLQTIRSSSRTYDEFLEEVTTTMSSRYAEVNLTQETPSTEVDDTTSVSDFDFSMDDWL